MGVQVIGDEWTIGDNKSACLAIDELMVSQLFYLLEYKISGSILKGLRGTLRISAVHCIDL